MKIGITGASGMLGTALIDRLYLEHKIYATSRKIGIKKDRVRWDCFDLLDVKALHSWLEVNDLDIVIHCAAIVNINQCEKTPDVAKDLHYKTTKIIAECLQKNGGRLIYISTDHLFDGKKSGLYTEKDRANPLNIYAQTKLEGEKSVLSIKDSLILRTSIIGWSRGEKLSFAEWIVKGLVEKTRLNLFDDVFFSPLHVSDLSDIVSELIKKQVIGLYNATSSNSLSKYDFGLMTADIFGLKSNNIVKSTIQEKKITVDRPLNMGLSSRKLSSIINKKIPTPKDSVRLLKQQYDNGWLSSIKGRPLQKDYHFWE